MNRLSELVLVVQTSVGLVFLASGLAKILNLFRFVDSLEYYGISRRAIAISIAIVLTSLELSLATFHILGWRTDIAAVAGSITILLIIAAVSRALQSGSSVPCLCFGGNSNEKLSIRTLIRLIVLLVAESLLVGLEFFGLEWPNLRELDFRIAWHLITSSVMCLILVSWLITAFELARSQLNAFRIERERVPPPTTH